MFFDLKSTHSIEFIPLITIFTCKYQNMVPGLYDPAGLSKSKSEEALAKGRDREIKNGRLAMIGIAGLYAAATIEGSVPLQPPC